MQDPEDIVDYHVHLVGHGDGGSGCTVHQAVSGCGQGCGLTVTYIVCVVLDQAVVEAV